MSIIQQIQEKYAKLMAIIIALALIIFVVMLAFENGGSLFRNNSANVVGRVNGKDILIDGFEKKVEQQESFMKNQGYGMQAGPASRYQAIESTWGQEVNRMLVLSEMEKLGLDVTKREMGDLLYGSNPPQDLKQQFTDTASGQYDGALAKQQIDGVLKSGTPEQKEQLNNYFNQLEFIRLNDKYTSLLSNSINFPKWLIEKQNTENSQLARISYVREFYTSIPDSTVKITDKEIEDYVSKHKSEFKQEEEARSIAYVSFSALPSAADSAAARKRLTELKADFDTTHNVKLFLEAQGVQNYYDSYINGNRIQIAAKDSFLSIPVNTVYGPYLDGNSFSMAKLMGVRSQPDTVDVRHILIGLTQRDPQSGQEFPIRDSATAYKLADSILTAIRGGANFDSMVVKFSDDLGSKNTGGKYEKKGAGEMVAEFNDYMFSKPIGQIGIVNTQFGSHIMEVTAQKGSSPAYKVAYLTQPIEVSNETDADAAQRANMFAGQSTDQKSFDANVEKLKPQGILKMIEPNIAPNSYQLQVGLARSLVKKIFEADLGDVVQPEKVGDNYVVAIVTGITKKGVQSGPNVRLMVEPILRNQKKAEIIAKKLNNATTLEAAAAAWGGKQIEVADSLSFEGGSLSPVASEPKVLGAAFNPANKGKVTPPIYGQSGVIVMRVDNVIAVPLGNANVEELRKQKIQQAKQQGVYPQSALREAASIKDNRLKFY